MTPGYIADVEKRVTTEELVAEAQKAGVKVTVTQRPKGTGEIVLLPGMKDAKLGK